MIMNLSFCNSIFSFFLINKKIEHVERGVCNSFGQYYIYTDTNATTVDSFEKADRQLVIIGKYVDVFSGDSLSLAKKIIEATNDIDGIIDCEKKLGGKYVIFYRESDNVYCLGDATGSMPVYYTWVNNEFCCSSKIEWIREWYSLECTESHLNIRQAGDISQALPYDITVYKGVRQLLPNHYIDAHKEMVKRFVNYRERPNEISPDTAAKETLPLIENLLRYFLSCYTIYCPITSGRDSRVVLAFMKTCCPYDFQCYTIKHDGMDASSQELQIPHQLTAIAKEPYSVINDQIVPETLKESIDNVLGKGMYSHRTLQIGHTIQTQYGDGAIVNGDSIGQVGKCSLHRDIPERLAGPHYFRCKLHNYSKESIVLLKKWMDEIDASGENVNLFDLFSIENRLGRWAAQENLLYNELGQVYLNIFNSRSILYTWTAVNRKYRKNAQIHIELIKRLQPSLLSVPFEADGMMAKVSKSNGIIFYLSSFAKYYLQKILFLIRKGKKSHETFDNYSG